jgi:hypothetical protein
MSDTDVAGQLLQVGDRVATLYPQYRYKLAVGTVVKFTPKGLKVNLGRLETWHREDQIVQVSHAQVAKVPK